MGGGYSDRVQRQVDRLFRHGAVGMMSDAQLLDRFVNRRDAAAEAAFEELVIRHGPMVMRVSRSVLHDAHYAEDAFQAVFLILASRAGSVRRKRSVASWLFGVAHRVATRARRDSARRHIREQRVAALSSERAFDDNHDPDREILHEEIHGLPEPLRAPIVLCYLQGLTYAEAAHQLGLSEMAIRGRLARARDRLRRRLTRRGVTASSGLLAAGAAHQSQAAIPLALIQSTIRIALGFVTGNTVAVLARGVLFSMILTRLRTATILVALGLAGSYSAWQAVAAGDGNDPAQTGRKVPTVQLIHAPVRTIARTVGQPSLLESPRRTPVYSRMPGYIKKTMVDIGDKVKKGDVLARVLVPELVEHVAAQKDAVWFAEQRVEVARKLLAVAEAEVKAARAEVAEAKANVVKYQAEVERWDTEVKRLDREVKRGVVDPQVLHESTNQWKSSTAARDAAHASVAKTEAVLLAKEAALEKAKLDLAVAEADLAGAQRERTRLESRTGPPSVSSDRSGIADGDDVAAAQARLTRAREIAARDQSDVDHWEAELSRLRQVVDQKVPRTSSGPSPEKTRAQEEARVAIRNAEERLRSYRASVSKGELAVSVAGAALAVARTGQRRNGESRGHITLTAPHDGLIVARSANAGDVVTPPTGHSIPFGPAPHNSPQGTSPLFEIDRIDVLRVSLEIPERDAGSVHVGTKASVLVKGFRDEPIEARVARTSWVSNAKSRTLRVQIDLPNPDGRLVPGMYAFAKVILERPGVRALPLAAVTSSGDQSYCWILQGGRAVRTEIRTGISDGQWIEVERRAPASRAADAGHGVWTPWDGSERVILGDLSSLHDGDAVQVNARRQWPE